MRVIHLYVVMLLAMAGAAHGQNAATNPYKDGSPVAAAATVRLPFLKATSIASGPARRLAPRRPGCRAGIHRAGRLVPRQEGCRHPAAGTARCG